jgi:branched-chain amino acid transport system permease protein
MGLAFSVSLIVSWMLYQLLVLDPRPSLLMGCATGFGVSFALTRRYQPCVIGALCAVPVVAPFWFPAYDMSLIGVLGIIAIGQNVITGYAGQLAIGNGALAAIGAYTVAILVHDHAFTWWQSLPVGIVAAGAIAFLLSIPVLRLQGPYLAMATVSLAIVLPLLAKATSVEWLTHGVEGIQVQQPRPPDWLPGSLTQDQYVYLIVLGVGVIVVYLTHHLLASRHGRALRALRDGETAAGVLGVRAAAYKRLAFTVCGLLAGAGGALQVLVVGFISPDQYDLFFSIQFLVMIVVGGLQSVLGAVVGAAIIFELEINIPQLSVHVGAVNMDFSPWLIYGLILIVGMTLLPDGLTGLLYRLPAMSSQLVRRLRSPRSGFGDKVW